MALNASKVKSHSGNKTYEVVEPGVYPARLVQIIDFGVQPQRPFQGKEKAPCQEIGLTYELVDEFLKDEDGNDMEDKPRWQSEIIPLYSLNQDRAKSTQRYNAFDPEHKYGGDFTAILGEACNVTLVHNVSGDKTYVNVANVSAMRPRDAQKCPDLVNTPKVFDLDDPDLEVFRSLPEWIQEKIKGNLNYQGSKLEALLSGDKPKAKAKKEKVVEEPREEEEQEDAPW